MYIPPELNAIQSLKRAAGAGSGIAAGGLAAKNSGGDERSTRFILGFGIGVPVLLILIGGVWYFRRRRARKKAASDKKKKKKGGGAGKNGGRGRGRRKRRRWRGFGWPERLKPVPAPAAYRKSDKDILPSML
ncbi:hypothetical protein ISF_04983 [Cordyceps fumosorosea ARSEF 2679]|uniref:Uncharacterized protein n=1 Tax=Cordyceps fumosorosea (strain ARSEF 2679) TaxID=1081104 RepID=A0A167VY11_CORFA|nr:hypothetical protein ISF_04983 [Cordyceps fumosorosea ARSEF 2679]OAA63107.1 hypothetical protein ISF_04983 [Cordyceps fumosorosea ARSEF 2679]